MTTAGALRLRPETAASTNSADPLALSTAHGRLVLTVAVAAIAISQIDAIAVNMALPRVELGFSATASARQLIITAYLAALASGLLVGGALGDRFGRKRTLLAGTVAFTIGALISAGAPRADMLIASRFMQGAAAALIVPNSLAIVHASFTGEDRPRAIGAWVGLGGLVGVFAPFGAGLLIDGLGWRWALLASLPAAAIALACSGAVPETRAVTPSRIDTLGSGVGFLGLAAATIAITQAQTRGWSDPSFLAAAGAAIAGTRVFIARLRASDVPLIPRAVLASHEVRSISAMTICLYAAIGVTYFLVTYQLQLGAHWSALSAGIAMLPTAVVLLIGSPYSGTLAQRIGSRRQLIAGPILIAGGLLLLRPVDPDPTWIRDILPGATVFGVGLAVVVTPLTATAVGSVDADHTSVASGINNAIATTANLIGITVVPTISGLATATDPQTIIEGCRRGLAAAAILACAASGLAYFGLRHLPPTSCTTPRAHSASTTPVVLEVDPR